MKPTGVLEAALGLFCGSEAPPVCVPDVAVDSRGPGRTRHHSEVATRHRRVDVTAMISAAITAFFGIQGLFIGQDWWVSVVNLVSAAAFVMIPRLCGMGEIVAPVVFFLVSYFTITVLCIHLGTGSGLRFFFAGRRRDHALSSSESTTSSWPQRFRRSAP